MPVPKQIPLQRDAFPLKHYRSEITKRLNKIASLEAEIELLNEAIVKSYGERFQNALKMANKEHGKVTMEVDGVRMSYEVRRSVSWDQEALQKLRAAMLPSDAKVLISERLAVRESEMKNCIDQRIHKLVDLARTVKFQTPKIEFYPDENA